MRPFLWWMKVLRIHPTVPANRLIVRRLLLWSQDKFLSSRAVHVPGVLNLAADFLWRQKLRPGEWMLNRQTVAQIWDLFGKAEVDLFASQESSQCALWFSLSSPASDGLCVYACRQAAETSTPYWCSFLGPVSRP